MITLPSTIGRKNIVGVIFVRCHTIYSFPPLLFIYPAGLINCYLISVNTYASTLCGACDHKVGPSTLTAGTYMTTSYQVTSTNNKKNGTASYHTRQHSTRLKRARYQINKTLLWCDNLRSVSNHTIYQTSLYSMSSSMILFKIEKKPRPPMPRIFKLNTWCNLDYIWHEIYPYLLTNMYNV